ncbi:MAG TPA: sensor domain-containing protein, partial [Nocardioidaceae bacterium]|nr:sensor domain-containing protein [Nocardioidaceae bacterium]
MPDLFDPLRNLDDLPVHPLPPDQVRRQGDRMRRRRHALQALGAAAAVAVVASGTALGLSSLDDPTKSDGTPVSAPEDGWLTEIPTHYPLDRGWPMIQPPEESQNGPSQKFAPLAEAGIEPCGTASYPSAAPIDSVGTEWNAPEDMRARELTLYPDSAAAGTVLDRMVDAWQACPTEEQTAPPFERTYVVTRSSLADESWTIVKGTSGALGLEIYNVARVGNAVLISWISNHGSLDASAPQVDAQAAQVEGLVADMCIFALDPCVPVEPEDVEPKIPSLSDTTLLTTDQLVVATGLNGWELLGQREDPTLDCQSVWLRNL